MKALIVDIGSNSIRAMEVEYANARFGFFDKRVYTTRLAEGLLQTGRLSGSRMEQSLERLCALSREASAAGIPLLAYATSAVRDAINREEFLRAAMRIAACRIDVLSGEQEARLAFLGATGGEGGLIDIGGGSTQIVTGQIAQSCPLGCVRAKDACANADVHDLDAVCRTLAPLLKKRILAPAIPSLGWTGVGGTITTLAAFSLGLTAYDRSRVQSCILSRAGAESALRAIAALGPFRGRHPLLSERHDVILPGGAILLYLMDSLSISDMRVSDADGMEGYAMQKLKR